MASLISNTSVSRVFGCGEGGARLVRAASAARPGPGERGRGPARREPYVVLRAVVVCFRPPTKVLVERASYGQAPRAEAGRRPAWTAEQAASRAAANRRGEARKTSWPPSSSRTVLPGTAFASFH